MKNPVHSSKWLVASFWLLLLTTIHYPLNTALAQASVYGYASTPTYVAPAGTLVQFQLVRPMANYPIYVYQTTFTATVTTNNGYWMATNIECGIYNVIIGPNLNALQIAVPANTNTYNVLDLQNPPYLLINSPNSIPLNFLSTNNAPPGYIAESTGSNWIAAPFNGGSATNATLFNLYAGSATLVTANTTGLSNGISAVVSNNGTFTITMTNASSVSAAALAAQGAAETNYGETMGAAISNWANATFSTGGSSGVSSFGGATGAITVNSKQLGVVGGLVSILSGAWLTNLNDYGNATFNTSFTTNTATNGALRVNGSTTNIGGIDIPSGTGVNFTNANVVSTVVSRTANGADQTTTESGSLSFSGSTLKDNYDGVTVSLNGSSQLTGSLMGTAVTNWINLVGTTITNWANATFSTGGSSGVSSFGGATGAITLLSSQLAMSGNELYSLCQIGSSTLSNFVANITVNASGQFTNSPWCLFTNTFSSWTVTSNGWVFTTTNGETVACTNGIVYASGGFQSGGSGTGTLSALSGNLTLNASTGLIVIQTNDNVLGSEYVNTNLYASNAVVTNSVTVNGAGNSGTAGFIGNGFGITNVWDTNVNVACVTNQIQTNSFHGTAANDYTNWWLNVATNHVYRCSLQTNNAAYCLTNLQGLVAGQDNWVDLYLQNTNSAANITLWWATGVTTPVTGYIPILNGFTNGLLITNSQGWFHLHGDIYGTNYMSNATWEASWPSL